MNTRTVFLMIALAAVLANIVILILIMTDLNRRGHKTSMLLARIFTFKYLSLYKEETRKATGKPGPLYGLWIFTINLVLVAVLAAVLVPLI
ncbi:MAG: hypothetical protein ACYDH3_12025 [Candidatus Aminicenantales bacterium]